MFFLDINAVPDGMDEHFWEKTKQKRVKVSWVSIIHFIPKRW